MRLRVHDPGQAASGGARPRGYGQPTPLHVRRITQQTPDGPRVDHVLVWHAGDGRSCSRCPLARCTFAAGEDGVGSCVVRRKAGERFDPLR